MMQYFYSDEIWKYPPSTSVVAVKDQMHCSLSIFGETLMWWNGCGSNSALRLFKKEKDSLLWGRKRCNLMYVLISRFTHTCLLLAIYCRLWFPKQFHHVIVSPETRSLGLVSFFSRKLLWHIINFACVFFHMVFFAFNYFSCGVLSCCAFEQLSPPLYIRYRAYCMVCVDKVWSTGHCSE